MVLQNILTALQSLGRSSVDGKPVCTRYKVDTIPTGYMLRAALPNSDPFEISDEDMLFLKGINPARIDGISVGRSSSGASGHTELYVRILDSKQRIMITSTVLFYSAARKRMRLTPAHPPSKSITTTTLTGSAAATAVANLKRE